MLNVLSMSFNVTYYFYKLIDVEYMIFCADLKSREQECPCDFLLVVLLALLLLGWRKGRQRLGVSGADYGNHDDS